MIGPNADDARNLFGDYAYPAHVESLREVLLESGRRARLAASRSAQLAEIDAVDCGAPTVLDALRNRLGGARCASPAAATSAATRRDGFDEAVAVAQARRRRGAGHGRQVRPDRRLHERREPRPRLARSAGRPGGARPRGARDGHAGGARARRRQAVRRAAGCTSAARPCCSAWLPGEEGADAIADALVGEVSPGGKLPISYPAHGRPAAGLLRAQDLRRTVALEGRLRRRAVGAALPVRPRPRLHDVRADRRAASDDADGRRGTRRSPSTSRSRTPATARRRGRAALRPRPAGERHAAGARAEELRPRRARPRASRRPSRSRSPSASSGSTIGTLAYVVEPGIFELFVGTSSTDLLGPPDRSTVVADASAGTAPAKAFDGSVSTVTVT